MRRWNSEAGSLEGVARHMGFRCTRGTGLTRSAGSTGRWWWPRWGGSRSWRGVLREKRGGGGSVRALQRLVQQIHELALALAQTAPQVAECLQELPIKPHILVWRKLAFEASLSLPVRKLMIEFERA